MSDAQPLYRAAIIGTGRIAHTYDHEVLEKQLPEYYQGENRHLGFYVIFLRVHNR